ncbi:MAG: TerB family tellurite resistance protein [Gammaproteobacteria bacterium]|jgi:uncharacterized tellurite resistance protein B-like protein|nr:TerB family tellurite resistance protein [Gammaproteobacteria bacterium]
MIDTIQQFFRDRMMPAGVESSADDALRVAAAALLFEAALSDFGLDETERQKIGDLIRAQFHLDEAESRDLLALAERQAEAATDLHTFTSLINAHWDEGQRSTLIDHMWQVVFADGKLDDHELHLMRKIQRLLHIPHAEYVAARLRHKPR